MRNLIIDDSVFSDVRYHRLCAKMGDAELALGTLICAWKLAQDRGSFDAPIPFQVWDEENFGSELVDVNLAKVVEGGVLVVSPEEFWTEDYSLDSSDSSSEVSDA